MMIWLESATSTTTRLTELLERARQRARQEGRPLLASWVEPVEPVDPIALFAAAGGVPCRQLWLRPDLDFGLAGLGSACMTEPSGSSRFRQAGLDWRRLLSEAEIEDGSHGAVGTGPLLLGGFAFDPGRPATARWLGFPDTRLVLPRLLLTATSDACWLTGNVIVWPDDEPADLARGWLAEWSELSRSAALESPASPIAQTTEIDELRSPDDWQRLVGEAAAAVRAGELEKVVLAREIRVRAEQSFDVAGALAQLRSAYPNCYVFAFGAGNRVFLGATPERLVRLAGREVEATCLAGSTRRGDTSEEDRRLGEALLASEKDRLEHAIVVRTLVDGLSGLCDHVRVPAQPVLLTVSNVHHLFTPVVARLREGYSLLDLVERLHPTPAVGGFPRERALGYIRQREGLDRGWYAAPVGWLDRQDGGEFAVALRSALVEGNEASLFAGCGIVADSVPEQEYAESWLKFRPMLAALGGNGQ